jgi:hypothetical protein
VPSLYLASKELSRPKKPLLSASPAKGLMAKTIFRDAGTSKLWQKAFIKE